MNSFLERYEHEVADSGACLKQKDQMTDLDMSSGSVMKTNKQNNS